MDAANDFTRALEERLAAKGSRLDRVELKKLKEAFKIFQTAFQGVHAVLLRKGVIDEDPYKYELKISEVGVPSEQPFAENEKHEQMSIRLSQFESHLDFLNNYYQFSVDFLTMGRIKRLLALARYFNFQQFSETSNQLNTRYFAELLGPIRKGTDQLSTGVLNESITALDRSTRDILSCLKTLTDYHKERWKLELRKLVLSDLRLERDFVVTHRDEAMRKVKHRFAELVPDKPFYPELADEALSEDHAADAESRRDAVMKRLEVPEEKRVDAKGHDFKATVLDGVRGIVSVAFQADDAVQKLQDNHVLLQAADRSFISQLRRSVRRMFGGAEPEVSYEVEFVDSTTGERKRDKVAFMRFMDEAGKKVQSFKAMSARNSAAYKRIEGAPEEQAFKYLERAIEEVQRLHKTMSALDEFFKARLAETESKDKVRGIKVELSTMKNAIIKANQKKYEYAAQKEEVEQFRKLGIRTDAT